MKHLRNYIYQVYFCILLGWFFTALWSFVFSILRLKYPWIKVPRVVIHILGTLALELWLFVFDTIVAIQIIVLPDWYWVELHRIDLYQVQLCIVVACMAVMICNRIVALYFVWKHGHLNTLSNPSHKSKKTESFKFDLIMPKQYT